MVNFFAKIDGGLKSLNYSTKGQLQILESVAPIDIVKGDKIGNGRLNLLRTKSETKISDI